MKPFNLENAIAGEPVKTRDGNKAYVIAIVDAPEELSNYHLIGYGFNGIHKEFLHWGKTGKALLDDISCDDIVGMWEEPTPTVTLKLPCPPENVEDRKFGIFISDVYCRRLTKDIYFAKREDIEEWVRALSNLLTIKKEQEIKELENATTN